LLTTCTAADGTVQLVQTFDEIKMQSAKSVTKEQQTLIDQVFSQMSIEQNQEQITGLKAKNDNRKLY
jgi:hypothetical protein